MSYRAVVLVDVCVPYCTSKVEHLIEFEATVSKIFLRYLGTSGKRFGDMAIFSVDFFSIL